MNLWESFRTFGIFQGFRISQNHLESFRFFKKIYPVLSEANQLEMKHFHRNCNDTNTFLVLEDTRYYLTSTAAHNLVLWGGPLLWPIL